MNTLPGLELFNGFDGSLLEEYSKVAPIKFNYTNGSKVHITRIFNVGEYGVNGEIRKLSFDYKFIQAYTNYCFILWNEEFVDKVVRILDVYILKYLHEQGFTLVQIYNMPVSSIIKAMEGK